MVFILPYVCFYFIVYMLYYSAFHIFHNKNLNKQTGITSFMEELWVNKYLPRKISDVHGQDAALKQLKDFVFNFKNKKKGAAIAYGPAGSGKTAAAYAIANEINLEIVETSASDFRNEEQINLKVGNAVN